MKRVLFARFGDATADAAISRIRTAAAATDSVRVFKHEHAAGGRWSSRPPRSRRPPCISSASWRAWACSWRCGWRCTATTLDDSIHPTRATRPESALRPSGRSAAAG
jgi:hypothetical protein